MSDERIVLAGDNAVALWKQGREAWNAWVAQNSVADVNFTEVNFANELGDAAEVSFLGFRFPRGRVSFAAAAFAGGDVSFVDARFGDGDVHFHGAAFGDGAVDFSGAAFGSGHVSFDHATFGDADFQAATFEQGSVSFEYATFVGSRVSFHGAEFGTAAVSFRSARFENCGVYFSSAAFGDGFVTFREATFGDGAIAFSNATFGHGSVSFDDVTFGDGDVFFAGTAFGDGDVFFGGATFGRGNVNFVGATFGDGRVYFTGTKFGDGNVSFHEVMFGDGDVSFRDTKFGDGDVNFTGSSVGRAFVFSPIANGGAVTSTALSFRRCQFDGVVILEGTFTCIPDLRSTITQGHVDLQNLRVDPWALDWSWPWIGFSKDPNNDVPALRRLKELAEANRHHDAALRFFADERRAMRWNKEHLSKTASLLEWAYDWLCRYGQSVGRPAIGLASILILFAAIYALESPAPLSISVKALEAVYASTSNILPFIPAAFDIRRTAFAELYPCGIPPLINGLRLLQGLLGFLFLFLIGLGLRNRFRM